MPPRHERYISPSPQADLKFALELDLSPRNFSTNYGTSLEISGPRRGTAPTTVVCGVRRDARMCGPYNRHGWDKTPTTQQQAPGKPRTIENRPYKSVCGIRQAARGTTPTKTRLNICIL